MDTISTILDPSKFQEPPEVVLIKDFITNKYSKDCSVQMRQRDIVIVVPSSALAGTLRYDIAELQELIKTDKKLVIRIG